ncbi:MAG: AAA family ATPase [Pseudomonadota bacterium]
MPRKRRDTKLPAPFLRRLTVLEEKMCKGYPFNLPWMDAEWELSFEQPVTIIVGENGTGKSTLIEAIAALAGYDEAGGGKGYMPVDHSEAIDRSGADLSDALRAAWLPRVTDGWFFRAESFFSVARYLDEAARGAGPPPDYLSNSHGEGFLRFFDERMGRQGIYFMDEPESALSPRRQLELLRILAEVQSAARAQVIMATHSPILMAVPDAAVLQITRDGLDPVDFRETPHFRLYKAFGEDPEGFIDDAIQNTDALLH